VRPAPVCVADATSNDVEPQKTIERPSKRNRQVSREPKPITKPFSLLEEQPREIPIQQKLEHFDHQSSSSAKKKSAFIQDIIPAPASPPSLKVGSTEAFHTRSNLNRKLQDSVKPKLCTVPAVPQKDSGISSGSAEQLHIDVHNSTQIQCSNVQLIPAPCILLPARSIPQSQLIPSGRVAASQTRSIGIQVELQPISDMKIM
jgi:hypothetical protein